MRKLFLVTLAVAFLAASAVPAIAIEPKFSGNYRIRGESFNETTADGSGGASYWDTRMRLKMDLIASKNLKVVYQLEVGDIALGGGMQTNYGDRNGVAAAAAVAGGAPAGTTRPSSVGDASTSLINDGQGRFTSGNGAAGTDTIDVETKHLYIDLNIPKTGLNLKAGLMPLRVGHGIVLDNDFSALVLTAKTDPVEIGLFTFKAGEGNVETDNDIDFYGLSLNSALGNSGSIGLYGIYARANDGPGGGGTANTLAATHGLAGGGFKRYTGSWLGVSGDVTTGIITIAFEADYYEALFDGETGTADAKASGYLLYADVAANMKQAKVGIAGFYASGDDDDSVGDNSSERFMPILPASREDYAVLNWDNMFMLDGIGQYGANTISNLVSLKLYAECTAKRDLTGGVSIQGYWKAQDSNAGGKGNDKYYGTEIDIDVAYKIYDQLTYNVNAAYMIADDEALGGGMATTNLETTGGGANTNVEDIWFIGHSLVYNF